MNRLGELFNKFLPKEEKVCISNDVTAMDGISVARKKEDINNFFFENLAQKSPFKNARLNSIKGTELYNHFESLSSAPKYAIFFKENERQKVIRILDKISISDHLLKELKWMSRLPYRYHHTLAVTLIVARIMINFYNEEKDISESVIGALVHDIGITRIPREILTKSSSLLDSEIKQIREHPIYSYILLTYYLADPTHPYTIAGYTHHEDLKGTGYPNNEIQENILARCIRIADIYDALISDRPFRPALTSKAALETIEKQVDDGLTDPNLFDFFKKCFDNI